MPRYTVSRAPWGYGEAENASLRYALTDNQPTHVSVFSSKDRGRILVTNDDYRAPRKFPPFRHLCYASSAEELQALADVLNGQTGDVMLENLKGSAK